MNVNAPYMNGLVETQSGRGLIPTRISSSSGFALVTQPQGSAVGLIPTTMLDTVAKARLLSIGQAEVRLTALKRGQESWQLEQKHFLEAKLKLAEIKYQLQAAKLNVAHSLATRVRLDTHAETLRFDADVLYARAEALHRLRVVFGQSLNGLQMGPFHCHRSPSRFVGYNGVAEGTPVQIREKRTAVLRAATTLGQLHTAELDILEWHRKILENATNQILCAVHPQPYTIEVEVSLEVLRARAHFMRDELAGEEAALIPLRVRFQDQAVLAMDISRVVQKLPNEVLCMVFQEARDDRQLDYCSGFDRHEHRARTSAPNICNPLEVISHVCKRWRKLCVGTKSLWSLIRLKLADPWDPVHDGLLRRIATWLERAGEIPLTIRLTFHTEVNAEIYGVANVMRLLTMKSYLWRDFEILGADTAVMHLLSTLKGATLPNLERLSLTGSGPVDNLFLASPKLREVRLKGVGFMRLLQLPLQQLQVYEGQAPEKPQPPDSRSDIGEPLPIIDTLRTFSNLTSVALWLSSLDPAVWSLLDDVVTFPRLQHLQLDGPMALCSIRAPVLTSLSIDAGPYSSPFSEEGTAAWSAFVKSTRITSFHMRCTSSSYAIVSSLPSTVTHMSLVIPIDLYSPPSSTMPDTGRSVAQFLPHVMRVMQEDDIAPRLTHLECHVPLLMDAFEYQTVLDFLRVRGSRRDGLKRLSVKYHDFACARSRARAWEENCTSMVEDVVGAVSEVVLMLLPGPPPGARGLVLFNHFRGYEDFER